MTLRAAATAGALLTAAVLAATAPPVSMPTMDDIRWASTPTLTPADPGAGYPPGAPTIIPDALPTPADEAPLEVSP